MKKAEQAPLKHLYDNHKFCGAWYSRQSATMEQKTKAKQYYCIKEKYGKMYVQMKKLFSEFMSRKHLEECHHKYDTQLNEGLNTNITMAVPKHKTHGKSMILHNQISIVIGVQVWGEKKFWSAIFLKLDMDMSDGLTNFWNRRIRLV